MKLNVACGGRYHDEWVNVDFHADSSHVRKVNILSGLPFDDSTFDVVYSSHFLEHLSIEQERLLMNEVLRVLKLGGVFRVVVPDLEDICREYLNVLGEFDSGKAVDKKHEWIVAELIDQLVRVDSGGQMGKLFNDIDLADYILMRTGDVIPVRKADTRRVITFDKLKNKFIYLYLKFIRFLIPKNLRDLVFVNTSIGERHQWMYDRYSMTKMLRNEGFSGVHIEEFNTSRIEEFNKYNLDTKADGTPYKGQSSLYVEAVK